MRKNVLRIGGWAMAVGGIAASAAAHALFFIALTAAQPAPAQYLGRLAAPQQQLMQQSPRQLAADAPALQKVAAAQPPQPEHLHKGLTTC